MYEININICAKLSFFCLSARTSKKSFKNDLREPPRPLPPGGKIDQERSQDAPKELQDGPKSPPYNFPPPPFPPGAPSWGRPGAHDAPGGLQKPVWDPRGAKFDPRGGRNLTPGASFFGPPGVAFFNLLRTTFARRWGNTMPTMLSRTGPPSDSIRQACGRTACQIPS